MIDMVMDQPTFSLVDRLLDRMQLLRKLDAATTLVEHLNDSTHVPIGALEPLDDILVGSMNVRF
jgi:hypothetical protein